MSIVKKLRTKFIIIATVSVFVLLAAILVSVNVSNFVLVATDADAITQKIANNKGKFDENIFVPNSGIGGEGQQGGQQGGDIPKGSDSPETLASIRYFTCRFSDDVTSDDPIYYSNISTLDDSAIASWGESLKDSGATGWSQVYFRYRTYSVTADGYDWTYVTVIDETRELSPSYQVLYGSIIGSSIGIVVAFIAIFFISKWVFKPLEESQRKQKRFISNASHELKTPLAIISANAEILEIEHGENESTEVIQRQVKRMSETVKNLNALAKIDEVEEPTFGKFNLSDAANEIGNNFLEAFHNKNKTLTLDIQKDVQFKGDEGMMRQLITIIFENALKYSDSKAHFSLKSVNGRVSIEERNDASSVKDGPLDSVFERFYRSEEARASSIEGSGIGLSIAKEVVEIHKGRIYARGENQNFIIKADF